LSPEQFLLAEHSVPQPCVAGSIAYICQPFGSLSSGMLVEWLGRKRFMLLLNIPFLLGWILMCTAPNYGVLCVASVLVGVTIGLTEAPINSYIGEVCQPEIRGMMTACAGTW
jgi:MFS family permease